MRIAWYLGFGWLSILTVVACGFAISRLSGPVAWLAYVPFLLVALYMTVRFRLYSVERWRRVHARSMIGYGRLAGREYDAAGKEGRPFDVRRPCRGLVELLLGPGEEVDELLGEGRKTYYRALAADYAQAFVQGIPEARHAAVLDGVRRDIDASELGPDIVIARAIERKHDRREAALYLRALLTGQVR